MRLGVCEESGRRAAEGSRYISHKLLRPCDALSLSMDPTTSLSGRFADLSVGDQNSLHDRVALLDRVSPERDVLIDADHKSLDAEIMAHFSAFRRFNEEPDL